MLLRSIKGLFRCFGLLNYRKGIRAVNSTRKASTRIKSAMSLRKRPDWSRRLPRPLIIPKVMTIATLADVRKLVQNLPADRRKLLTWQLVAADLDKAAAGGDVALTLRIVLMLERVECRPRRWFIKKKPRGCRGYHGAKGCYEYFCELPSRKPYRSTSILAGRDTANIAAHS